MLINKPRRIVDPAYRRSAQGHDCMVCGMPGNTGTVVLAHIRIAGNAGTGLKPSDDESLFLCSHCHYEYDTAIDRNEWIVRQIVLNDRREAYRTWKASQ